MYKEKNLLLSKWIKCVFSVLICFYGFVLILYDSMTPAVFASVTAMVYICFLPPDLMNPRNMVFAYYFISYGIAPIFATRYMGVVWNSDVMTRCWFMLLATYYFSQLFLYIDAANHEEEFKKNSFLQQSKKISFLEAVCSGKVARIAVASLLVSLFFLLIYIEAKGFGFTVSQLPIFITRKGLGGIYLGFTLPLYVFSVAMGALIYKKQSKLLFGLHIIIISLLAVFISGRSKILQLLMIAVSPYLMKQRLFSRGTMAIFGTTVLLLLGGNYLRNINWMREFEQVLIHIWNYFDTLYNFACTVRDFEPDFMRTFLMPMNWIFVKLGVSTTPYYDMSVWLNDIYRPGTGVSGGHTQWPIETDMYLSFGFFGGFLPLFLYLKIINILYKKSRTSGIVVQMIYMIEFVFIAGHYRGGILSWWYIYWVPFYIITYYLFKRRITWEKNVIL